MAGLVDHPFELTYDELLSLQLVEADVTLTCVSNIVGGDLIGNARWLGVPLIDLLERAGVRSEATQVVGRSADRFTVGFPTAALLDGRSALVAIGMNGEPLPVEHGFPARLVVAGLYGYVSATKWLTEIELSTFDAFDAYWIRQGWAREGPIKNHARIDVPRPYAEIAAGRTMIAGVAWAPTRGIRTVEVQVDDRPWRTTTLAAASSDETWRQWTIEWDAAPGAHLIRVRATDGSGARQTATAREPFPDGATGLHTVAVRIAG
ncbi:MAG: molybdopterin-dependent oxidoreductase [Acidimicrobiales bacterium]